MTYRICDNHQEIDALLSIKAISGEPKLFSIRLILSIFILNSVTYNSRLKILTLLELVLVQYKDSVRCATFASVAKSNTC